MKFTIMFFLIPALNSHLTHRFHLSPLLRDLRVAQYSIVLLTLGTLAFALAPSIPIVALALALSAAACALPSGLRCVVMHLTPPASLGMISTSLAWVSNVGGFFVGPFFAATYKAGLRMGVAGLPYLIVTVALVLCCAALLLTPLPEDQLVGEERAGWGHRDAETDVEAVDR